MAFWNRIFGKKNEERKSIQMPVEALRAICFGFVNMRPSEQEAFQLALDLMERWNPKLFEQFKISQPDAKMRVFTASSLERLTGSLNDVGNSEYSDCSVVLQIGSFEMFQRSTQSSMRAEVILATFWQTESGNKIDIVAPGLDFEILPLKPSSTKKLPEIKDKGVFDQILDVYNNLSEIRPDRSKREKTIEWWQAMVKAMPGFNFSDAPYPLMDARGRCWSMLGSVIYYSLNPEDKTICRPCKESRLCWLEAVKCDPEDKYWKEKLIAVSEIEDVRRTAMQSDPALQAAAKLRIAEHDKDVAFLITQLEKGDHSEQEIAALSLGRIQAASAVPALEAALDCGHYNTSEAAFEALSQIGDPAVPVLVRYLQVQENAWRRKRAAVALGQIGHPQALPWLENALKTRMPEEVEQGFREVIKRIRSTGRRDFVNFEETLLTAAPKPEEKKVEEISQSGPQKIPTVRIASDQDGMQLSSSSYRDLVRAFFVVFENSQTNEQTIRYVIECGGCRKNLPEDRFQWKPGSSGSGSPVGCVLCGYMLQPVFDTNNPKELMISFFVHSQTPGRPVPIGNISLRIAGLGDKESRKESPVERSWPGGKSPQTLLDENDGSRKASDVLTMLRAGKFTVLQSSNANVCASCGCSIGNFPVSDSDAQEIAAGRKSANPRLRRECRSCSHYFCNACVWLAGVEKKSAEILYHWQEACPNCSNTYLY